MLFEKIHGNIFKMKINDLQNQIKTLQITFKKTNELIPYVRNSRKHSESQIDKIASSIREFGFLSPCVIQEDGTIVCGHARILAAKKLKIEEIPTISTKHLTETQVKAYVIADNQLASLSEWDGEMLNLELTALKESDFDISLTGFDEIPGFQFEAPNEEEKEEGEKKFSLQVKFENEDEQQLLFFELRDRGFKVKS